MKTILLMCCTALLWTGTDTVMAQESTKKPVAKMAAPSVKTPEKAVPVAPDPAAAPSERSMPVELTPEQVRAAEQAEIDEQIDAALMRYSNLRNQFGTLESNWLKKMDAILSRYAADSPTAVKTASVTKSASDVSEPAKVVHDESMKAKKSHPLSPSAAEAGGNQTTQPMSEVPAETSLENRLKLLESRIETLEKQLKAPSGVYDEPCAEGDIQP